MRNTNAMANGLSLLGLLCLLLGLSSVTHAWAQQTEDSEPALRPKVASLVPSPGICVLQDEQESCQMEMVLIWEVPQSGNFCVWEQGANQPLQCWQGSWNGTLQINFQGEQDRTYILTRGQQETLVSSSVRVMGALEQRIRARRRSGFWRVF